MHEPGLSFLIDSQKSLSSDDQSKIFGQIGAILSVAIFEQRKDAIEIQAGNQEDVQTYLSKPFETFCQENVSFMMKHLNMTNYASGLRTLFNSEIMHDSHYKQVSFAVEKQKGENGGEVLTTRWKIAYVTERNTKDFNSDLEAILQSKVDSLIPCANCDNASILLHTSSKDSPHLIYEKQNGRVDLDQLEMANKLDLAEDSDQLLTP